jgi:hypothetical protein
MMISQDSVVPLYTPVLVLWFVFVGNIPLVFLAHVHQQHSPNCHVPDYTLPIG